ncbi:MAG: hypothetical protein RLY86_2521 [Pseudomonadota bacterium]|jgi:uncharacterized protein (DUF433 family)
MPQIHYSPQEAAAVARVPLSAIQKAITGRAIPARLDRKSGGRRIDETALLALALSRSLPAELTVLPRDAYALLRQAGADPRDGDLVIGDVVRIDTGRLLAETRHRLALLERARDLIVRDPDILGGTPVIRGTRIPPHALLDRVRDGDTVDDILAEYPQLDRGTVEAALIHAEANPLRGRPKGKPWLPGS